MGRLAGAIHGAQALGTHADLHLQPAFECQRGALHIGLECAAGAWRTSEPATGRLVADVATKGETLIADLALRHDTPPGR